MKKIIRASIVLLILAMVFSVVFLSGLFRNKDDPRDMVTSDMPEIDKEKPELESATFSLGCFWGPDARFGAVDGV